MKIAFLAGLSSIHTVRWANAFAERAHEVHVITSPSHSNTSHSLSRDVRVHLLPFPSPFGYYLNAKMLKNILRGIDPNILNVHYASGYGTLGRLSGFHPSILSVWGSDVYDFPYKSCLHKAIVRQNLLAANIVCSTSNAMAQQTHLICPQLVRIEITPFGVDTSDFRPMPEYRDTTFITVGTVKTLAPQYGIDTLLEAFAYAKERLHKNKSVIRLRLMIIGDGPQEKELKGLAQKMNIHDSCMWIGKISHEEVPKYLNQLDIYVALSRSESFGVAVIEASACGLPVVVSDAGGLPEVVLNSKTGLIVKRDSPEEAGEALLSLIKNKKLRNRIACDGQNFVQNHYEWKFCVDLMEKIFFNILSPLNNKFLTSAQERKITEGI